jgi:hypothetical protein
MEVDEGDDDAEEEGWAIIQSCSSDIAPPSGFRLHSPLEVKIASTPSNALRIGALGIADSRMVLASC